MLGKWTLTAIGLVVLGFVAALVYFTGPGETSIQRTPHRPALAELPLSTPAPNAQTSRPAPAPAKSAPPTAGPPPTTIPPASRSTPGRSNLIADATTPWDELVPGDMLERLSHEEVERFDGGLHEKMYKQFRGCVGGFKRPTGLVGKFTTKLILDVETYQGGYEIKNAHIESEEIGDDSLDRCFLEAFVGLRLPSLGAVAGQRMRINYPLQFGWNSPP